MGDKMLQYRGLTFAAWGYFFLNFGFSIDGIQLLPEFVGYLLLLLQSVPFLKNAGIFFCCARFVLYLQWSVP